MSVASHHTETPAADAAKLLIRLGLTILMVALPCVGVVARGAIYVLMPIGAILILIGAVVGAPDHGPRHLRTALLSPAGLTALFLTFWAGLSLAWTPFPGEAAQRFAQIVGTTFLVALVAAFLPARTRAVDLYLLPVGATLSALAMLVLRWRAPDWFIGASEFDDSLFERSMITLIVLVWPALGALSLREHWILAAGLAMLAAAVALVGFAQIGLAAMGAAAFVFALAMSNPGALARILGFVFAGLVLFAPMLPLIYAPIFHWTGRDPGAASQSMLIWRDLIISEWPRLITGHGFDTANHGLGLGYLPPLTPKSLLFVIWYDLGVIGAVAFAFLTARIFRLAARSPAIVAPSVLAGFVAVLTLSILGVATAQIWWVTLIDCAVIAFIILIKGIYRTQRPAAPMTETALDYDGEDAASAALRSG
ncbi:conserved membrane hypothetical protein [Methylocella tundrae]|uniref:O-antigen polymerase n=1 Tax=Methylocella tundrae TaxID=227605 RepID=A0A8B6M803_METTU|nr:hypothetical protein [Methylocella tundrae]VTZ22086.1 conserved membrane hypothetical protein [Methylocella tundrae]VTZ50888.1 conserved membrane hypothetical protein [Methylocella tundrae]